jgi:hypothetical protein
MVAAESDGRHPHGKEMHKLLLVRKFLSSNASYMVRCDPQYDPELRDPGHLTTSLWMHDQAATYLPRLDFPPQFIAYIRGSMDFLESG